MASTVNSVPAANNASGNAVNAQNPSARPTLRSSASTKASDGNRRQSGSPFDGGQRRSNSQKAWSQGNPITQRSSYAQQNGSMPQKQPASSRNPSKESNTPDNHAHDRLVFLLTSFIGLTATVTSKTGEKYTGVFSSASLEPNESSFLLKMVQRPNKQEQHRANGVSEASSPFMGSAPDHSMSFDVKDIVDISVSDVSTTDVLAKAPNGASVGFKTDTDISGNLAIRERTLKRWEPAADTDVDLSLDGANASSGWDQFEANARLFGATSSYDENIYTTRIDRSDPAYKLKEAEAARIAREIEGTNTDNVHVREERGLASADDGDEEEKYSGVRRDEKDFPPLISGQPNKYTPPARRQNAAQSAALPASAAPARSTPTVPKDAATATPKETAPVQAQSTPSRVAPAPAPVVEAEKKPAASKPQPGPALPAASNATANVEVEVLDSFRRFADNEKAKMQERRRNQASYDRTIKLNELMKFSKNFKLATPVPKDLVPILAKDPHKQEEIIQRAQQHAEEKTATKASPESTEPKPVTRAPAATTAPPLAQTDRSNISRGRQMFPPTGPNGAPAGRLPQQNMHAGRQATGMLGHRLADNLQQRKGVATGAIPAPLPINEVRSPPSGPAGDHPTVTSPTKAQTPTSAVSSKFNVRAMEFKPNPAASTFTPGTSNISSSFARGRSVSRATSPSAFFGAKKPRPISERPSLNEQFNPIKRMKKESTEKSDKDYTFNGGIPPAYKTLPTWDVPAGNEEKTYLQMFKPPASVPAISPQNRSASNSSIPHQPQMPFQYPQSSQGMPPTTGPPHGPHLHPQQHHGSGPPHFDDPHRMQLSASTSQIFPSPRLQHGYPSPMAPHAQLAFGQPMPQFYVNQGGPQPAHMRHYPGTPQFVNPQSGMGAPMMIQQPSSGPYMGVPQGVAPYTPQMQMYSPNPGHAYPQHAPPPQPHSGYPSPSRGAPMMMHQNSQQGQPPQPVMFMSPGQHGQPVHHSQQPGHMPPVRGNYPQQQQTHFQSSPHQVHHYPPHQHRTPSTGYNQMPQGPPQVPAQPSQAASSGAQPQEAADEVK
ncbi:putative PAB1 binding protein (Pbp1) [Aspergillus fijiensis CBS 313.89]|uniref:Putative PAB1 binding protein n=1 Tax=Aspergillus fijiensis CBS 313.89 TaxID=1448319 RepID=A0A8G1S0C8_9EURO|nr:putative PAB1 binding protein [Aspergillus fijiensis CBS 313.89]RAK82363.1 putative PAB1 binding protein [Aspergillus fijiensis CBS 313.89]